MGGLTLPVIELRLAGRPDPVRVQIANADQISWEIDRAQRNWPDMDTATNLWAAYVAWCAMRRTGQIDKGQPWAVFHESILTTEFIRADDADPFPDGQPDQAGGGDRGGDVDRSPVLADR